MKKRRFFAFFLLFFLSIYMQGCSGNNPANEKNPLLETVNNSMQKYCSNRIDLNYSMSAYSRYGYESLSTRFVSNYINSSEIGLYSEISQSNNYSRNYYMFGHHYEENLQEYSIEASDVTVGNPIADWVLIAQSSHGVTKKVINESTVYTLTFTSAATKEVNDFLTDYVLTDFESATLMTISINNTTGELDYFSINIEFKRDTEILTVSVSMTVNAYGDDVKYAFPSYVIQYMSDFAEKPIESSIADYSDTNDGIIDYDNIGTFRKILYDNLNNQIVVLREESIDIYSENTFQFIRAIQPAYYPTDIDVNEGRLVICFGTNHFDLYSLSAESTPIHYTAADDINGYPLVIQKILINRNQVIYDASSRHPNIVHVYIQNLDTDTRVALVGGEDTHTVINKTENVIYICALAGTSRHNLTYYNLDNNLRNGSTIQGVGSIGRLYEEEPLWFDGMYVNFDGRQYDGKYPIRELESEANNEFYNYGAMANIEMPLLRSQAFTFFRSNYIENKILIYDHSKQEYVYCFDMSGVQIIALSNQNYLVISSDHQHIAIIHSNLLD